MSITAQVPAILKGRSKILYPTQIIAEPGTVLGIIGPNGAGKSTLLRSLAGLGNAASVLWQGAPLPTRRIAFMPQAFQIAARLTVLECVLLGRREALGWRVASGDLEDALRVLDQLGLSALGPRSMDSLSGGQQQMVLLAQRLLRAPQLMLLDEPTSALDLHHQMAILRHLTAHTKSTGAVLVMALHDLTLAARFCNRLILLHKGKVHSEGPPTAVLTHKAITDCWEVIPEILHSQDGAPVILPT